MERAMAEPTRAFRMALDIDAPVEAVWRALTDAEELVRWFPTGAHVTPGIGGTMRWSWGEGWDWETRIDAWEPGRLLRLVQEEARPYDSEGRMLSPGDAETSRLAIELTLEPVQGTTRVRMVHSGFGEGAAWDDELEGITEGWQAELRSLRHYLERHPGSDRLMKLAWRTTTLSRVEAWARLVGPGGFTVTPADAGEGHAFALDVPGGPRFTGMVQLHLPRQTIAGTVRELGDGWVRLLTWSVPGGGTGVWAGLASYREGDAARVEAFRQAAAAVLERLFG